VGAGIGPRTRHQSPGRPRNGGPARITFVVSGNGDLAHARHAVYRVHAIDAARMEVQLLDRAHDVGIQAAFLDIGLRVDGGSVQTDGVAAGGLRVVLAVARVRTRFRRTDADITDAQIAALPGTGDQQCETDGDHAEGRLGRGQSREAPPQRVL